MADPLSTAASFIGLISFAKLILALITNYNYVNGAGELRREFSTLAQQVREFFAILYARDRASNSEISG